MKKYIRGAVGQNLIQVSVGAVGVLLLLVGLMLSWQAYQSYLTSEDLKRGIAAADSLLSATAVQARERGLGAFLLARPDDPWARRTLVAIQEETDRQWSEAFHLTDRLTDTRPADHILSELRVRIENDLVALHDARNILAHFLANGITQPELTVWLEPAAELIVTAATLHDHIVLGATAPHGVAHGNLVVKRTVWVASENAGQNRAILAYHAAAGQPVAEDLLSKLTSNRVVAQRAIGELIRLQVAPGTDDRLAHAITLLREMFRTQCRPIGNRMYDAVATGNYPMNGRQWFDLATGCIDTMLAVSEVASEINVEHIEQMAKRHLLLLVAYTAFAVVAGILALLSLVRVRRNASEFFRQKELAEITLSSIGDAVITTDSNGNLEYINPVAQALTGWSAEEARGRPFREVFQLYNTFHGSMTDPVGTCLSEGLVVGLTSGHVLIRRDGVEIPIEDSAAPIRDYDGKVVGAVVVFYDTRKSGSADQILSYHATRDSLTGLVNRREFERQLEELLTRIRDEDGEHALAYIDLDQFKLVNDTCGHTAGDRLLRQIAFLLQKRVRDSDTLARLGGDEFGLLLRNCSIEHAMGVAEELRRTMHDFRFPWEGKVFQVGLSIGLVPIKADSISMNELLSEVDAACYAAKEKGRNRVQVYHPNDLELSQRQGEMHCVARIREALEADRLVLYCQPILPLRSGLPRYLEITVRLLQEDGTIMMPMTFISAAERYNLMPDIDRWVIRHACMEMTDYLDRMPDIIFSLNLSGTTLSEDHFADYIRGQAAEHGVSSNRLCFEITETAAIANLENAVMLIDDLRSDGFSFALDDFGSGLSSLAYLKNLPVQLLKIDGTFVRNMKNDSLDYAMVQSFAAIGQAIHIATCAEFVETETIIDQLTQMEIDYAQGYAISRPVLLTEYLDRSVPETSNENPRVN